MNITGADGGTSGIGTTINLVAGGSNVSAGGAVNIDTGSGLAGNVPGGDLNVTTGNAYGTTQHGGDMFFNCGAGIGTGTGGGFNALAGQAGATGDGGIAEIRGGDGGATSGDGGDVHLVPGNTQTGDHGQVFMGKTVGYGIFSAGTISSNTTINRANGTFQSFTFGAAATAQIGISTVKGARMVEFLLEVTNGGQGTLTWAAAVQWAGGSAPTLTAAGKDLLRFVTRDGGVSWMGYDLALDLS